MEREIYNALINLSDAEKTEMVKKLAAHYNCSISTIWRKANKAGIKIRAERSDKGSTNIDETILELAGSLINKSKRKNDKYTFDIKEIYRHLTGELGLVINVSYPYFCELLRKRGLTKDNFKKPAPHVQLISEHPNQMHEFDVSICLMWYFDTKTGQMEEDIDYKRKFYAGKVEKYVLKELQGKKKLHRYVLVDHTSGAFYFRYYLSKGENSLDGSDFLFKAWSSKKEMASEITDSGNYQGLYQFQGLPKYLYTDKGSILRRKAMQNLLKSLNIELIFHETGNPRAKGMVEGLMNIIEKGFESRLKIFKIKDVDELNKYALKWCIERNLLKEFRSRKTARIELWRKITKEQFIKCPDYDVWAALIQEEPVKRKVDGNGNISYNGSTYALKETNLFYKEVIIKPNAFDKSKIFVHDNGFVWVAELCEVDEWGRIIGANAVRVSEYKKPAPTDIMKFDKKSEEILTNTYGVDFKGKNSKRTMKAPNTQKEETMLASDNIAFLEPQGESINPNPAEPVTVNKKQPKKEAESRYIKLSDMIRVFTEEFGRISVEQRDKLTTIYPKGCPAGTTIQDLYNALYAPNANVYKLGS